MVEPIRVTVDAGANLTGYITPETTNAPLLNLEPSTPKVSPVPSVEEVKSSSGFYGWLRKLFGFQVDAENIEPENNSSPFTRVQAEDYISQTAKMEANRKESLEEEFGSLLTEAGLDRAYVMARVKAMQLERKELIFDEYEMKRIWALASEFKTQIDKALEKQHGNAANSKFFGKIEMGSATMLLSVTIVVAAIALSTGGAVPALMVGLQAAASITTGIAQIAKSTSDYKVKSAIADYKGATENRRQQNTRIEDYMYRHKESGQRVADNWKSVSQSEEERKKVMEGVIKW